MDLRKRFEQGQSFQLISQRSRPSAYLPDSTTGPLTSGPGVVEINIVKAGFLYRREGKRKNIWREWGVILTASQLYFFKDIQWFITNIIKQQGMDKTCPSSDPTSAETVESTLVDGPVNSTPSLIMRPLVDGFLPTQVVPTTDMVALRSTRDAPKGRDSFLLAHKGGSADWFSSPDSSDLEHWMHKINFAASFSTFYVPNMKNGTALGSLHKANSLRRVNSDTSISAQMSAKNAFGTEAASDSVQKFVETHFARKLNVEQKLEVINNKLANIETQLLELERTANHLKLLVPLQPRTREAVHNSATRLASNFKWKWIERRKLLCYKSFFELDLEAEQSLCKSFPAQLVLVSPPSRTASPKSEENSSPTEVGDDTNDKSSAKAAATTPMPPRPQRAQSEVSFQSAVSRLIESADAPSTPTSPGSNLFFDALPSKDA